MIFSVSLYAKIVIYKSNFTPGKLRFLIYSLIFLIYFTLIFVFDLFFIEKPFSKVFSIFESIFHAFAI
jgi:hypothetical protein